MHASCVRSPWSAFLLCKNVESRPSRREPKLQGIRLNLKEFVTHDNCQSLVRRVYYCNTRFRYKSRGYLYLFTVALAQCVLTPLYALAHTLNKMRAMRPGCCKRPLGCWPDDADSMEKGIELRHSGSITRQVSLSEQSFATRVYGNLDSPVNRLVSHGASYLMFISWILLSLANPYDKKDVLDVNVYDFMSFFLALGFFVGDVEQMYTLAKSVAPSPLKQGGVVATLGRRLQRFFSTGFLNYRFVSHLAYLVGQVIESVGYVLERDGFPHRPKELRLEVLG